MDKDSFKERERAQEEGYFRAQDAKLLRSCVRMPGWKRLCWRWRSNCGWTTQSCSAGHRAWRDP